MTKRMLVDATHPEETRVAIVETYRDNNRLEDLDFSLASKPILRGNIYLAKVMRVEPSLQAAFVEYGGNRHGFLPFSEIHPDYFRIPVADRPQDEDLVEDDEDENDDGDNGENGEQEDGDNGADLSSVPDDDDKDYTGQDSPAAASESSEASEPADEQSAAPALAEDAGESAKTTASFPHPFGEDDAGVGLITDFGNAAVGGSLTEVPMSAAPPESVGGEVTERIVRQHRPRYKIQEVLKRGQVMLIQVVKEERGNKGAALTTFLSLAGRYCVLMPNTDHGGGVSRKITNHQDRRRMKEILDQLEIPEGMAVILRTAGMEQDPPDIQRDLEYLLSMWDSIREQTLASSAPALIYEEANLIKRSVRDLYAQDISEILIAGQDGYQKAYDFMHAIMPDEAAKIKFYTDPTPLFVRFQVENQIDTLHSPIVQLRSGGYLVINPTEALVSIDVNSGRATRERHIEETAVKTNLEAAEEIARQLRLRDLAGLVVIDFIDMEDGRNNAAVERRIKESMKNDRARLQIGRISPFGLLELSRQRLRPSLMEISFEKCPHCTGTGYVRSADSAALSVVRAIEEEAIKQRTNEITVTVPTNVAVYILNHKRAAIGSLEERYGIQIVILNDDTVPPPGYKMDRAKGKPAHRVMMPAVNSDQVMAETERDMPVYSRDISSSSDEDFAETQSSSDRDADGEGGEGSRRGRGRFRRKERGGRNKSGGRFGSAPEGREERPARQQGETFAATDGVGDELVADFGAAQPAGEAAVERDNDRRRRRGRRGGRRRHGENGRAEPNGDLTQPLSPEEIVAAATSAAPVQGDAPYAAPPHSGGEGGGRGRGGRGRYGNSPRHGGGGGRFGAEAGGGQAAPAAPFIPISIHDLDTTPKPVGQDAPRNYETINPPSDETKGGWWRRLTGQ